MARICTYLPLLSFVWRYVWILTSACFLWFIFHICCIIDFFLSLILYYINIKVAKFFTCNVVVFMQSNYNFKLYASEIYHHVRETPVEILKVSVPSFLYVIQNNLLYLALSNLDAATYQVCYQLKILTTALFSATMLKVSHYIFAITLLQKLVYIVVHLHIFLFVGFFVSCLGSKKHNH